jgi:hypothetical protein
MLGRRRPSAPANDATVVVPVFTADPHGAAIFAGILSGGIGAARPVIDTRVSQAWHGRTQQPQEFRGVAYAGNLGGGRPSVVQGTTLDQERGMTSDSVQSIFEQRMAARRFS